MILTITLNPSVDISYSLEKLSLDTVNRVSEVSKTAGGKGLNVTRVLEQLGNKVVASGFLGGELGLFIENRLNEQGTVAQFQEISGQTRNCIAILHEGKQTEILEAGPTISQDEQNSFLELFKELIDEVDLITISGSLPKGVSSDFYSIMIEIANKANKKVLLDSSGEALKEAIEGNHKPYLIKPNVEEINDLLDDNVTKDINSLKTALTNDYFSGIEWIVVSMGADGAFVKHNNDFYKVDIPKIKVVNPVGSGDSTVAGLAHSIVCSDNVIDTLKTAMTTGMLNTMEEMTGYININNFDDLFNQVTVNQIN